MAKSDLLHQAGQREFGTPEALQQPAQAPVAPKKARAPRPAVKAAPAPTQDAEPSNLDRLAADPMRFCFEHRTERGFDQLNVRVGSERREALQDWCKARGVTASAVLDAFIYALTTDTEE